MIKYVLVLLALFFTGCAEENIKSPSVFILKETVDNDDLTDLTIMCIDNVKYVIVPGIGMSVKLNYFNLIERC